jgi:Heparinase II/III-like protein
MAELDRLSARWPAAELQKVLRPLPSWSPPVLDDDLRRAAIARAEQAMEEPFPSLAATGFLEAVRTGSRAGYDADLITRRRILRDLVVGEALEREGRFLEPVADALWATCEQTWWGSPAHVRMQGAEPGLPDPDDPLVDLWVGETAGALAWAMHLLGRDVDEVDPMVVPRVRSDVRRRVLDPCLHRDDFWWMGLTDVGWMGRRGGPRIVNNWNPWITSNWITAAVLLEDDPDQQAADVAKALRVLDQYLAVIPADGSCEEGTGYWSRAGGTVFEALELLGEATGGAIDLFDHPTIRERGRFPLRMHLGGPWFVDFGDGSARPEVPAGVVYRYGCRIGDPSVTALGALLLDEWRRLEPDPLDPLARVLRALDVVDEASRVPRSSALSAFTWLPGDQVMVARDAAGTAAGVAVAARGGHNGASHGHNDIGSFIVAVDGEPLVVDAGIGTYTAETFGPGRAELWTVRSGYHNVPRIGGHEQGIGSDHAADLLGCADDADGAGLALDLAGAYPDEAGIDRWERTITLRRGEGLAVVDIWELQQAALVELNLLLRDAPVVDDETGTLRWDHAAISFEPPPARFELERVPLDDPKLEDAWDRHELWRATATYPDTTAGSVRTTVGRAS